jgi:hypothetical protein
MGILTLEEIIPQTGEFTLSQTKKTYHLRPFSVSDEIWLKANFGGDKEIQRVFDEFDLMSISKIAFHQMVEQDKVDFKKAKVKIVNDDGDEEEFELGGYKLLFGMISGWQEKRAVLMALLQTIGVSRPAIEKLKEQQDSDFKKKLNQISQQIGQPSSTSSTTSTDGQKSIS